MDNLINVLSNINDSLIRIAEALERQNSESERKAPIPFFATEQAEQIKEQLLNDPEEIQSSLESVLFKQLTDVYFTEELERIRTNRNKKSSRRVSVMLGEVLVAFFTQNLGIYNLSVARETDGLLVFYKDEKAFATLKYLTDLGYCRSNRFYDVIRHFIDISERKYDVPKENVFILVASLHNSIEKSFVELKIKEAITSNNDFLNNKTQVRKFIDKYKEDSPLPNCHHKIFFLASEIHPNDIAFELTTNPQFQDEIFRKIESYDWYCQLKVLLDNIKKSSI